MRAALARVLMYTTGAALIVAAACGVTGYFKAAIIALCVAQAAEWAATKLEGPQ